MSNQFVLVILRVFSLFIFDYTKHTTPFLLEIRKEKNIIQKSKIVKLNVAFHFNKKENN